MDGRSTDWKRTAHELLVHAALVRLGAPTIERHDEWKAFAASSCPVLTRQQTSVQTLMLAVDVVWRASGQHPYPPLPEIISLEGGRLGDTSQLRRPAWSKRVAASFATKVQANHTWVYDLCEGFRLAWCLRSWTTPSPAIEKLMEQTREENIVLCPEALRDGMLDHDTAVDCIRALGRFADTLYDSLEEGADV